MRVFLPSCFAFFASILVLNLGWGEETVWNKGFIFDTAFRQTFGSGIGYRSGFSTLEFMAMSISDQAKFCPFADFRGHYLNDVDRHQGDDRWLAYNVGVGFRTFCKAQEKIIGANVYYDFRPMHCCQELQQLGFGVEVLSCCWSARLNGYFPIGNKIIHEGPVLFDQFRGPYYMIRNKFFGTWKGGDIEIEGPLLRFCGVTVFGAAGPYYYRTFVGNSRNNFGAQMRLSAYWQYLTLDFLLYSDNISHTCGSAVVGLNIPLQTSYSYTCKKACQPAACGCWPCDLMALPVRRHDIIPFDKRCYWSKNW